MKVRLLDDGITLESGSHEDAIELVKAFHGAREPLKRFLYLDAQQTVRLVVSINPECNATSRPD